jgi:hypothetical protein
METGKKIFGGKIYKKNKNTLRKCIMMEFLWVWGNWKYFFGK